MYDLWSRTFYSKLRNLQSLYFDELFKFIDTNFLEILRHCGEIVSKYGKD